MALVQIGSVLLYASAGLCVFLMLLNRVFILMSNTRVKAAATFSAFAVLVGGGGTLGISLARPPWVYAPLALLLLVLFGEGRRAFIRRSCAGSGPVDTTPHTFNLSTPVTTTDLVLHRYRLPCSKWRDAPLRIVHLSDLHVHPTLPLEYFQEVVSLAEQSEPDLALFTGDFITTVAALPELAKVLRPIARLQTYAVLGNHDYWADPDAVRKVILESGLCLLSDETVALSSGSSKIAITGYDHPWGTKEKSIGPRRDDVLHVVLSHTPDNIYRISASSPDVVFSGHYHAGQIRIPYIGPIVVPSVYGRRFDHGHFVVNDTHLFVASGIGAASPPVRIYCQPDIFVVDVTSESGA
ncbi:MAG: hypothetical protein GY720_22860 [bacterium]|nr:hypothetical protein [bacterium]